MKRTLIALLAALGVTASSAQPQTPTAGQRAIAGVKPLTDMSPPDVYQGEAGGLYGEGRNQPPPELAAAAKQAIERIRPLDAGGASARNGRIGFISIGMSNASYEFELFKEVLDRDRRKSPRVAIVDGAQGSQAMAEWANAGGRTWAELERRLIAARITPLQVQVAWLKIANMNPTAELRVHGQKLQADTSAVLREAKRRFPNLQLVYLSSRIYAGYTNGPLNPEPYAFETGLVVRWLIRDRDPSMPVLLWGPYLWANRTTPRAADGLTWQEHDLAEDGVHPSESGRRKVVNMLREFFLANPLAAPWFTRR